MDRAVPESDNWDDLRSQPQIKSSSSSPDSNPNDEFRCRKLHIRVLLLAQKLPFSDSPARDAIDEWCPTELVKDAPASSTEKRDDLRRPVRLLPLL
mmetsp:Transcript_24898/g.37943  ORF Transcript_24898/g.37943 Transcript_24898/m.37943 type:complete len:96 (+) Transcript_24898:44-331(+)